MGVRGVDPGAPTCAQATQAPRSDVVTPTVRNIPSNQLFNMLVGDFRRAWDAMAATDSTEAFRDADPEAGGNFLFARQAMGLLELASRVAGNESSGACLRDFGRELGSIEPLYFSRLPGRVPLPRDFKLPNSNAADAPEQLLAALFDLIRHGQSHQYQQIPVDLNDGCRFEISLTGVNPGRSLREVRKEQARGERNRHLSVARQPGVLALIVRPERLFLDFYDAARRASVFSGGIDIAYLTRPHGPKDLNYQFSGSVLERFLVEDGHPLVS